MSLCGGQGSRVPAARQDRGWEVCGAGAKTCVHASALCTVCTDSLRLTQLRGVHGGLFSPLESSLCDSDTPARHGSPGCPWGLPSSLPVGPEEPAL